MSTISKELLKRYSAQAEEANLQGFWKVSSSLKEAVSSEKTRDSNESFIYSENQLKEDIKKNLWKNIVRASDYYQVCPDALKVEAFIESFSEQFLEDFCSFTNCPSVGPFEPTLPGEQNLKVILEIEE